MSNPNILYILAYHQINDSVNFEKQLIYLKQNYAIISLEQLYQFLYTNTKLPKKPLLITFDDGDLTVYNNALPLLKKYNLFATLFVVTNLINTEKSFWWDEIEYYLGKNQGNKKVWEVKSWSNNKRETYLKNLRKTSQLPELKSKQLTISQLREMQDSGIIIGNHSHTHPMYDKCTANELEKEMKFSISKLKEFGFTPDVFAYPNGNFSLIAERIIEKYGVKMTFLFDHKINKGRLNSMRISRLIVDDITPLWKLKLILSGWHTKLLPLTRFIGKLRK